MLNVLTVVSDVLIGVGVLYPIGAVICCIIGLIYQNTEYSSVKQRRFAVLICARNEEQVIGNLLDSLALQDYPKECVTCFVVAHNCTDQTARIARKHGAVVFEWNHPMKRTKGNALHFGVGQITEQYPGQYEALCIFDADNLAGRSFLKEINAALDSGADVVTGFRCAKNYHQTPISELFGAYWYQIMYTQNIPNSAMGLPVVVGGTVFAVTMEVLKKGWNTETLLEDIEFSLQMILHEKRIIIAPRAVFYGVIIFLLIGTKALPESLISYFFLDYRKNIGMTIVAFFIIYSIGYLTGWLLSEWNRKLSWLWFKGIAYQHSPHKHKD